MPFQKNGKRNYEAELNWEHKKKPNRVKDRASRNKARSLVEKKLGKKAVAGKDVGHKKALSRGGVTTLANLFVQSPKTNRSFARKADGSMKSERSRKGK
jgi:hypothetical protein